MSIKCVVIKDVDFKGIQFRKLTIRNVRIHYFMKNI